SRYPGQGREAGVAAEREVRKAKKLPAVNAIGCGHECRNPTYGIGIPLDPFFEGIGLTCRFGCKGLLLGIPMILTCHSEAAERHGESADHGENRRRPVAARETTTRIIEAVRTCFPSRRPRGHRLVPSA